MRTLTLFAVVCVSLAALLIAQVWTRVGADRDHRSESYRSAASGPEHAVSRASAQPQPPLATHSTSVADNEPEMIVAADSPAPRGDPSDSRVPRGELPEPHPIPASRGTPRELPESTTVRWAGETTNLRRAERWAAIERTISADPSHLAGLEAAMTLAQEEEDWPRVEHFAVRLLEVAPEKFDVRAARAEALLRLRLWQSAMEELEILIAEAPESTHAWYDLALARQAAGQLAGALEAWEVVIELQPQHSDAFAHRGELWLDRGDFTRAAADFEQALQLDADCRECALNLALAQSRLDQQPLAFDTLRKLLERRPDDLAAWLRLRELCEALCEDPLVADRQGYCDAASSASTRLRELGFVEPATAP